MPVIKDSEHRAPDALHKSVDWQGERVLAIGCGDGCLRWRFSIAFFEYGVEQNLLNIKEENL